MEIELPYQWEPRSYQMPVWKYLHRGGKRAVTRWHRRSGKDDVFLNWTACAAHERVGNYWYLLPLYAQARKTMWDAISPHTGKRRIDQAFPTEIRQSVNNQEMKISLKCGSTVQLVGSDNYNSLVGSPPIGLVFSEYAISNPSAWSYLMPILEENNGWAVFNSTPRGKNHFYKTCLFAEDREDWFYDHKTVNDTGIFNAHQLGNILDELISVHGKDYGEALFQQEFYCSFDAAIMGAIWADCIDKLQHQGRISDYEYNPRYPVHVSYDIGKHDATAIWFFQIIANEIVVINYHESNHKDVPFYCELLRSLTDTLGYRYGTNWLPHDAWQDTLAAGGKTVVQQFVDNSRDGRIGKFKRVPHVSRQDGIQAARATFPICYFDAKRCEIGLEALRAYHHEWDDEKKCYTQNPLHDWSSNGSDSFRYLSLVWKEARKDESQLSVEEKLINNSIVHLPLKNIVSEHFRQMRKNREGMY